MSQFADRHIGPNPAQVTKMLAALGFQSLEQLIAAAIPSSIRANQDLDLPPAVSEEQMLAELQGLARHNQELTSMIGCGYSGTLTPRVILRNLLQNPAWYTAYTSYQAEISQGRLEALFYFQTMVCDLVGLPIANASLLDEPTAAAEAMAICRRQVKRGAFVVHPDCHPQTIAVVQSRAEPLGIKVVVSDVLPDGDICGLLLQYPTSTGLIADHSNLVAETHQRGALVVVTTDLLALTLLKPPGEWGADIAVGSAQRFGVPLGFGGPHAAFMAVHEGLVRLMPGRLVGLSKDAAGHPAYRLAMQTREQHIRRQKATSNICTAQVLLAVVSAMYAIYHGPEGLAAIATRVHNHAVSLAIGLRTVGIKVQHDNFFDTVVAMVPNKAEAIVSNALDRGVNLRLIDRDRVGISCDETTAHADLAAVWLAFGVVADPGQFTVEIPETFRRQSPYLTDPAFHHYRSETSMMRFLRRLADKDLALDRTSIPLGSCTMKLNAAAEMEPITWGRFANIHPFAPIDQATGYLRLIRDLERWLAEITGYDAVSIQPNAGSQGELAGLLAIRSYLKAEGQGGRNICLIPSSAHGTNFASAVMAGMEVVVVRCEANGSIDLQDLAAKIDEHGNSLAAIMVTYPSTHGVFEDTITTVCSMVHAVGGQVYVDGANLNALVGIARPGWFGADAGHFNLHKTFCIPHGGGGPGVGPVGVRAHLAPYLPNHPLQPLAGPATGPGPNAGAPWGSAGVLPIPWAYIRMMGASGLLRATQIAILNANYVTLRLAPYFSVLYRGANYLVAHECIIDLRELTKRTGITAMDVAKRLIDYGFHAPTVAFPVVGTLMIEPTESENLAELDRFCAAMIAIRAEIAKVETGEWPRDNNPVSNAPHTADMVVGEWEHPYTRAEAVFPLAELRQAKYWPPVGRIDDAGGDRNLICACPPAESYQD